MAKKEQIEQNQSIEEKKNIEDWKKELNIKTYIFEALLVYKNWENGKSVTKKEFEKAIKDFLFSPAGGKR